MQIPARQRGSEAMQEQSCHKVGHHVLTWRRSHAAGADGALGCASIDAPLVKSAACGLTRGQGATLTSAPSASRTTGSGRAVATRNVSTDWPRTQNGKGCPTLTTPTCMRQLSCMSNTLMPTPKT